MWRKFLIRRETMFQLFYAVLSEMAVFTPGITLTFSSVSLSLLKNGTGGIQMTNDEAALFASLPTVAQIPGCILCIIMMKQGRRLVIIGGDIVAFVGWILIATSYNVPQIFIARTITGIALGMNAIAGSVYIGEISSVWLVPFLTTANNNTLGAAVLFTYILGSYFRDDWRSIAIIATVIPLTTAILNYFFLPESPRWLLLENREEDARKSLLKLRGLSVETDGFQEEFVEMVDYSKAHATVPEEVQESSVRSINKFMKILTAMKLPEVWIPLTIMNILFMCQQLSGVYIMVFYASDFVKIAGENVDIYSTTIGLGLFQLIVGLITMFCSKSIGRRPACIFSALGMSISLAVLGIYEQFFSYADLSYIPITCIIVFLGTSAFGIQILPWALIGEIYPTKYVHVLGPLMASVSGIYGFISLQIFPYFLAYNAIGLIFFYCAVSTFAVVFIYLALPETQGRTKGEILEWFRKKKFFVKHFGQHNNVE